jgi:hypothetical protein
MNKDKMFTSMKTVTIKEPDPRIYEIMAGIVETNKIIAKSLLNPLCVLEDLSPSDKEAVIG